MKKGSLSGAEKFKMAANVAWRRVDNEGVILNLDTSVYYSVNPVGALIWEKLGEGLTLDEVIDEVCREYDVDAKQAGRDARELVDKLLEEKLLDLSAS